MSLFFFVSACADVKCPRQYEECDVVNGKPVCVRRYFQVLLFYFPCDRQKQIKVCSLSSISVTRLHEVHIKLFAFSLELQRIPHLKKCIFGKQATEIFEKVSIYTKVLSLNELDFFIHSLIEERSYCVRNCSDTCKMYMYLASLTEERSYCVRNCM